MSSKQNSLQYLASDQAVESLQRDVYWPKWDSPWWHMLLLHEMGETKHIPERAVQAMVEGLKSCACKIFPIHPGELPEGVNIWQTHCHCGLGNMYQVLASWGVDVDYELPWIRAWFLRYQMKDGGFNCDNAAYLVKDECPSSMVGTIPPFEAVLFHTSRTWTKEEKAFLDRGARFLIHRQLQHGSSTNHNREERDAEPLWLKPCFPRFYLYDVLRGLRALLGWAEKTGQPLPKQAIEPVVGYLRERFPQGEVRIGRAAYEGIGTRQPNATGEWTRQPASFFPLLSEVSEPGQVSPYLSKQWRECLRALPLIEYQ